MSKVLASPIVTQWLDNIGAVLNDGKLYAYVGSSTTPATTWTSSTGAVEHDFPIDLDGYGRVQGGIWVTKGSAYKFILKDAALNTIDTLDNVVIGETETSADDEYEVICFLSGTASAQQVIGGVPLVRDVTFGIDFDGSQGVVITAPESDFVITIKLNGVEVGTCTFDTAGTPTFATTGGTTVEAVTGDYITFHAPDAIGTASNIMITLLGALA